MEFPSLGKHCGLTTCKQLDFLPYTCDLCKTVFCHEHHAYEAHECQNLYAKDARVPQCPLCNTPVPFRRGEDPNRAVDEHIAEGCQRPAAIKTYANSCSFPSCKQREAVPIRCGTCRQNFCLKHRFEGDHKCGSPSPNAHPRPSPGQSSTLSSRTAQPPSRSESHQHPQQQQPLPTRMNAGGAAAERRRQEAQAGGRFGTATGRAHGGGPQGNNAATDDDEQLALAIQLSLQEEEERRRQEEAQSQQQSGCAVA